jgi:histidinol-phosphate/aromatic aminotransferase/cobyric acid decarboxylase-like protein
MSTMIPHGTLDYAEARALGVHPADLVVFSSNINPYGPPPAVLETLREQCTPPIIARYPDRLSLDLRDALAAHHDLTPDAILVGNGTSDILLLIGLVFLQARRITVVGPTYGEYAHLAGLMATPLSFVAHPGWRYDGDRYHPAETTAEDTAHALAATRPDVVFVCNPNNPTGRELTSAELDALYGAAPAALWVVDEAYADFTDAPVTSISRIERGNWLVLRSMTKDFALGGLRLGYVVGAPERIAPLQQVQPPWNVNTFAQAAGLVCLNELAWRRAPIAQLRADCAALRDGLIAEGYAPRPTELSFFLTPVRAPAELRRKLLAQRLVIRDCTSFGLPDMIRIAALRPAENTQLVAALAALAQDHALPAARP